MKLVEIAETFSLETSGNVDGTSFSGPIVAGIVAAWCGKNGYTLTTNNLTQLAKTLFRTK